MNAGFLEASKDADYDCYVFQDVDMIPEDVRNFYVCSQVPRHVGSHLAQWDYRYEVLVVVVAVVVVVVVAVVSLFSISSHLFLTQTTFCSLLCRLFAKTRVY